MTALSVVNSADFTSLQQLTGLTVGNLSNHLARLEEAGMVKIENGFVNKRPNTMVALTEPGKQAIDRHWKQLEMLRSGSQAWKPD